MAVISCLPFYFLALDFCNFPPTCLSQSQTLAVPMLPHYRPPCSHWSTSTALALDPTQSKTASTSTTVLSLSFLIPTHGRAYRSAHINICPRSMNPTSSRSARCIMSSVWTTTARLLGAFLSSLMLSLAWLFRDTQEPRQPPARIPSRPPRNAYHYFLSPAML